MYAVFALFSALFAGLTAILAKRGVRKTDSDVATALRTLVVLVFAWAVAWLAGSVQTLGSISPRSLTFLALSGVATGASWLCYFKSLSLSDVNRVAAVDKSSVVLTALCAMLLLGETERWQLQLACSMLIALGTFLMVEKKQSSAAQGPWLAYALASAVFAALTNILAKYGVAGVESNLATALRTCVVLVFSWGFVLLRGKTPLLRSIDRHEGAFIVLSALATGASWLCYFRALQMGPVTAVVSIDKTSLLFTALFARLFLGERLSRRSAFGLLLLCIGAAVVAIWG